MKIIHSLTKEFWDTYNDKDFYGDYSLNKFGFIHCSDINTYHFVAPNFKNENKEMILLVIDTEKVNSKIVSPKVDLTLLTKLFEYSKVIPVP